MPVSVLRLPAWLYAPFNATPFEASEFAVTVPAIFRRTFPIPFNGNDRVPTGMHVEIARLQVFAAIDVVETSTGLGGEPAAQGASYTVLVNGAPAPGFLNLAAGGFVVSPVGSILGAFTFLPTASGWAMLTGQQVPPLLHLEGGDTLAVVENSVPSGVTWSWSVSVQGWLYAPRRYDDAGASTVGD